MVQWELRHHTLNTSWKVTCVPNISTQQQDSGKFNTEMNCQCIHTCVDHFKPQSRIGFITAVDIAREGYSIWLLWPAHFQGLYRPPTCMYLLAQLCVPFISYDVWPPWSQHWSIGSISYILSNTQTMPGVHHGVNKVQLLIWNLYDFLNLPAQ